MNFIRNNLLKTISIVCLSSFLLTNTIDTSIANTNKLLSDNKITLSHIISKSIPAVVTVNISGIIVNGNNDSGFQFPQEFKDLLPDGFLDKIIPNQPTEREFKASGSGVILDANKGYIVTNNHVIDNAKKISVTLSDGRSFEAKLIGKDSKTDLAVIQIDAKNLIQLDVSDSNEQNIGDFVIAIGNPFGIGLTATSGIISAKNRSANLNDYEDFIQTDAAINRGNSGGALINLDGKLVGINSAILSPQGGSVGVGFAIPSNIVMNIYKQLITNGKVTNLRIGIRATNLDSNLVKALKLSVNKGAFISEVIEGSPAEKYGLKSGDVIVKFNNIKINNFNQLRAIIATLDNPNASLEINRKGQIIKLNVKLEETDSVELSKSYNLLGMDINNKDGSIIVASVNKNSYFAQHGVKVGDKIIGINNTKVNSVNELRNIIEKIKDRAIAISFERNNRVFYVVINN